MKDGFNPYAAPATAEPASVGSVGDPIDQSRRAIAVGLDLLRAGLILFLADLVAFVTLIFLMEFGEVPRHLQSLALLGNEAVLILAQCLALVGTSRCLRARPSAGRMRWWSGPCWLNC